MDLPLAKCPGRTELHTWARGKWSMVPAVEATSTLLFWVHRPTQASRSPLCTHHTHQCSDLAIVPMGKTLCIQYWNQGA